MSDTRTFILQLATENNISADRVEGIIKKLLDEWYETTDSLREITESQWATLSIPARLVDLIKKKLSENAAEPPISPDILNQLVEELISIDAGTLRTCMETLKSVLTNILRSPEEKYRRLKLSNPTFLTKVGRFSSAVLFLKKIGFQQQGEFLVMVREIPDLLNSALGEIDEILSNSLPSNFNPYEASVVSVNALAPKIVSRENDPLKLSEEIRRINSQTLQKVDRQARVIGAETTANITQERLKKIQEDRSLEGTDDLAQLAHIQSVMRQREEFSNFRSKKKGELSKLQEIKVDRVAVRVAFPDKMILEGNFSPQETARDVYLFVEEYLRNKGREFYLYEAPPKRVIKNGSHSLKPFAPASRLYFAWSDLQETTEAHGPFI